MRIMGVVRQAGTQDSLWRSFLRYLAQHEKCEAPVSGRGCSGGGAGGREGERVRGRERGAQSQGESREASERETGGGAGRGLWGEISRAMW